MVSQSSLLSWSTDFSSLFYGSQLLAGRKHKIIIPDHEDSLPERNHLGYFRVLGAVANSLNHVLKTDLEFVVDTGTIYTVISKRIADGIQLKEVSKKRFRTGSGIVELPVAEAYVIVENEGVTTLVAISQDDGIPLILGVTTLELLGLQVDPVIGKLKPLELLML